MTGDARVPVILVSGIAEGPMAAVTIAMQWDLPSAVVVRHEVDPGREVLTRTVSDVTGIVEELEIDVDHACVSCAIRNDIVPTLERLAASGTWRAIIAHLPVTAEPVQVCRAVGFLPDAVPHLRIAAAVAALDGDTLTADLLGSERLSDRGLPVRPENDAGVAETASAIVEYSDLVATTGALDADGRDLLAALARPGVQVCDATAEIDLPALLRGVHVHDRSEGWVAVVRRDPLPDPSGEAAWVLDFRWTGRSTRSGCGTPSTSWAVARGARAAASGCPAGPGRCANGTAPAACSASAPATAGTRTGRSPGSSSSAWTTAASCSPRPSDPAC
ncbi:MAG: hypothetical protein R2719_11950 [Micropruina sp.]